MNNPLKDIEILFGKEINLNSFLQMPGEEPFSEKAISFLNALSIVLRKNAKTNLFPEIITFAFFSRKANLVQMKKVYYPQNNMRIGRGVVFHISPSNMPLNFAYTLVSGILSGNLNIMRLPSTKFEQVEIICQAIKTVSEKQKFELFSKRILLVRYDRQSAATEYFSSICDARIIWGGDSSIQEIQKNSLAPGVIDITFADKYSICVINADEYCHEQKPQKIAQEFYNDTYLFDQNACTSPHLIVWLGTKQNISSSKEIFWTSLYQIVKTTYRLQEHAALDKLANFYKMSIHLEGISKTEMPDNLLWRIEMDKLTPDIEKLRCNCGYFIEYSADSLFELSKIISKKTQTFACYGIQREELMDIIRLKKQNGTANIVPIGKTSNFSLTWDGYNLIDSLSKEV